MADIIIHDEVLDYMTIDEEEAREKIYAKLSDLIKQANTGAPYKRRSEVLDGTGDGKWVLGVGMMIEELANEMIEKMNSTGGGAPLERSRVEKAMSAYESGADTKMELGIYRYPKGKEVPKTECAAQKIYYYVIMELRGSGVKPLFATDFLPQENRLTAEDIAQWAS